MQDQLHLRHQHSTQRLEWSRRQAIIWWLPSTQKQHSLCSWKAVLTEDSTSLDRVWAFKHRVARITSTNALTCGSISTTGNQVKNQLTSYCVGANYRDSLVPFLQPVNSQETINSIYRRIKGYLQNQAFPRKWGSLFDSQCKRNHEDQLASYIKRMLDKKEGEVERDGLNHHHIQCMARAFPAPGPQSIHAV